MGKDIHVVSMDVEAIAAIKKNSKTIYKFCYEVNGYNISVRCEGMGEYPKSTTKSNYR